jgi:hypothetical protein
MLCEVETIINSGPITTVTNDPLDLEALIPNHMLLLKLKPDLPPATFQNNYLYIRRHWKQVQYMADTYFGRDGHRSTCNKVKRSFSEGDVVLVMDPTAPRSA